MTAIYGIAMLVVPAQLNALYGGTTNDSVITLSRLFGAVSLGFTVLAIMGRNLAGADARRAVDAAFMTAWALLAGAMVWNVFTIPTPADALTTSIVWGSIALYAAFAIAFGYYAFREDARAVLPRARPA